MNEPMERRSASSRETGAAFRLSIVLDRITKVTSTIGLVAAAAAVVFATAIILVEISLRYFFDSSTFVLDEFVGYAVATLTFMALAGTFRNGVHVRVNLALRHMSAAVRQAVEVACIAVAIAALGLLEYYFVHAMVRSYERGAVSNTIAEVPVWIIQLIIVSGVALLLLEMVSYLAGVLVRGEIQESHAEGN